MLNIDTHYVLIRCHCCKFESRRTYTGSRWNSEPRMTQINSASGPITAKAQSSGGTSGTYLRWFRRCHQSGRRCRGISSLAWENTTPHWLFYFFSMGQKELDTSSRRLWAPVESFSLLLTTVALLCPCFFVCTWRVAVTGPISLAWLDLGSSARMISCVWGDVRYLAAGTVNVGYTQQDTRKLIRKDLIVLIVRAETGQQHASKSSVTELMPWILHERPLNKTLVRDDLYWILVNFLIYGRNVGAVGSSI